MEWHIKQCSIEGSCSNNDKQRVGEKAAENNTLVRQGYHDSGQDIHYGLSGSEFSKLEYLLKGKGSWWQPAGEVTGKVRSEGQTE